MLGKPIPTRHVPPSGSARAAAIVIISAGVHVAAPTRCVSVPEDIVLHPAREPVAVAADRVPGDVEVVVPLCVAVRVGRMRAVPDLPRRSRSSSAGGRSRRAAARAVDDLFDGDEDALRAEHGLLLHADDAPQLHIAGPVGLLRVDHGDIELERADRAQDLAGERAGDLLDRGGVRTRSLPRYPRRTANGGPDAPAAYRFAIPA